MRITAHTVRVKELYNPKLQLSLKDTNVMAMCWWLSIPPDIVVANEFEGLMQTPQQQQTHAVYNEVLQLETIDKTSAAFEDNDTVYMYKVPWGVAAPDPCKAGQTVC